MQAIRLQAQAKENGVLVLSGLPIKAGETVEVFISSASVKSRRKASIAEMKAIMDRVGREAEKSGLTEEKLERILAEE